VLDDLMQRAWPEVHARLRAGRAPQGVRSFAGKPGYMKRSWGPGWALVGDAGYWKDPISAHGLTDALRDAELLARAVISGSSGDVPEGEALEAYQAERDRLSITVFDMTDVIAGQAWSDGEIGGLLMQLALAMNEEVAAIDALDAVAVS